MVTVRIRRIVREDRTELYVDGEIYVSEYALNKAQKSTSKNKTHGTYSIK